jgi:GPH family glycoside/pentoside/hexuronide:cation symporter
MSAIPSPASVVDPAVGADEHAARRADLGIGVLGVYGAGAVVDAICTFCLSTLLYFYLTAVCGLSGTAAGGSLAIALVADSAIDPLVGSLSDNSRSRFGRRHPFMIGAAIPILVSLGLLFSVPTALKGLGLFAYATALTLALRSGLSLFNLPYIALGAELSDDYRKRSTIVAFRVGVGVMGTLAAIILSYGVFLKGPGGLLHRSAYEPLAWCCGLIALVCGLTAGFGTLGVRERLHRPTAGAGMSLAKFGAELNEVRGNPSFLVLFAACLLFFVAQGMAAAMTLHANTYFWRLPTTAIQAIAFAGIAGVVIGLPLVGVASHLVEKRTVAMAGLTAICIAQFTPVLLRLSGAISGSMGAAEATLMAASVLSGAGVTGAIVGFQSMMADAADEHEHLFHSRREGLYFAGISLSAKASSGLGVFIAGLAMDAIGFPHDIAAKGAGLVIQAHTARDLGLLYGPGAAVVTLLGVLVLFGYRLNRNSHAQILETLAARRQLNQVPGALA